DGVASVTRQETLANAQCIVEATPLPVTADLENGYGREPEACAETIRLAAATGLAGGSIEDTTGDPADPILPFGLAVERVRAAAMAGRGLPFSFSLPARAGEPLYCRPALR